MHYHIVWLDLNSNHSNEDNQNTIKQLRQIIDSVNVFTEWNECDNFITNLDIENKVFMVVSNDFDEKLVDYIQNSSQIISVYVLSCNHSHWHNRCKKVRGVFIQFEKIFDSLINEMRRYQDSLHGIINVSLVDSEADNLNRLEPSFMYAQLFKEIFLKIKDIDKTKEMEGLLVFLREKKFNNKSQLKLINDFEKQYDSNNAIHYYTKEYFIYSTLNEALRTQNIDIILKFGFFIRDLLLQITKLHLENANMVPSTVYRGQGVSTSDFDKLKNKKGALLCFNNFLSASTDEIVARSFAESNSDAPDTIGILCKIEIDRSISCSSYAYLTNASHHSDEEEVLFSMNTVFRVGNLENIGNKLWKITLALSSDIDKQLKHVTDSFRQEMGQGNGQYQLGHLMLILDRFDIAEQIYSKLDIFPATADWKDLALLFNQLGLVYDGKNEYSKALEFFKKTAEIEELFVPSNHPDLATTYSNIAATYHSLADYVMARSFYEKALLILPPDHPKVPPVYNNISLLDKSMGEYHTARLTCQKALEIAESIFAPNHPNLATIHENLATIYQILCEYPEALSHYREALRINKRTLPSDHRSLLITYNNMISVYTEMGSYSETIKLYESTLKIPLKRLVDRYPSLAIAYSNVGFAYLETGEISKALSYCFKALYLQWKHNRVNNLDMATTYSNIGHIFLEQENFAYARSFHEEVRIIQEACLDHGHPKLATTYNDLGLVYQGLQNYKNALFYLQKALAIRQQYFRSDHPSLASVFNNIGMCFANTEQYEDAMIWYKKALVIRELSPVSNYRNLVTNYNNIGCVYYEQRYYCKALKFFEKTLKIEEKFLGAEHPDLANTHYNLSLVLNALQQQEKAFYHFMQIVHIAGHKPEIDEYFENIYQSQNYKN
ncbi:unnamed protein product [Adineta ricciae]|uniref:NAD(P)(+)--arginine ADP-ribosyltransferase n=1 Tax=Adineta ricciae TaxID=249248 RepID=A0A814IAB0_ADIRI|nr:unnamed protein product [Adineta ricciae]CAF1597405.1 unnamed protein product [Adineta ricciae]